MTWLMALIEFLLRTLPVLAAVRLSLEAICDAMLVDLHDAHGRIRRDLDLDALRDIEDQVLGMHPLVDTLFLLASLNASGERLRSMPTRSHAAPSSIGAPDPIALVRRIREVQNRLRRLEDTERPLVGQDAAAPLLGMRGLVFESTTQDPYAEDACVPALSGLSTPAQGGSRDERLMSNALGAWSRTARAPP